MNGVRPPVDPRVAHLTDGEIAELLRRYQTTTEKVSQLMQEFAIDGRPGNLATMLPAMPTQRQCPYCREQTLFVAPRSRGRSYGADIAFCPSCRHQHTTKCECRPCAEARRQSLIEIETRKRETVRHCYRVGDVNRLEIEDLSLLQAVSLLAVFNQSVSQDLAAVSPYQTTRAPLAPTADFRRDMVDSLLRAGLVAINPESPLGAFVFNADASASSEYYPAKVYWLFLPGMTADAKRAFIGKLQLLAREGGWPDDWTDEVPLIWKKIALAECLEYYEYLLRERGYDAELGEKTVTVFEGLLQRFTVAQVFSLTWQAARDTSDYILKNRLGRNHAKNCFIGSVQRKGDRAFAAGWNINAARRNFECPQSHAGAVFGDVFAGAGARWLDMAVPEASPPSRPIGDDSFADGDTPVA